MAEFLPTGVPALPSGYLYRVRASGGLYGHVSVEILKRGWFGFRGKVAYAYVFPCEDETAEQVVRRGCVRAHSKFVDRRKEATVMIEAEKYTGTYDGKGQHT